MLGSLQKLAVRAAARLTLRHNYAFTFHTTSAPNNHGVQGGLSCRQASSLERGSCVEFLSGVRGIVSCQCEAHFTSPATRRDGDHWWIDSGDLDEIRKWSKLTLIEDKPRERLLEEPTVGYVLPGGPSCPTTAWWLHPSDIGCLREWASTGLGVFGESHLLGHVDGHVEGHVGGEFCMCPTCVKDHAFRAAASKCGKNKKNRSNCLRDSEDGLLSPCKPGMTEFERLTLRDMWGEPPLLVPKRDKDKKKSKKKPKKDCD